MKAPILRVVQTTCDHNFGKGPRRKNSYVEFSVLGEVVRAHVTTELYAKLKNAGVIFEELAHNKRVGGGDIGGRHDEFDPMCVCGHEAGSHAGNGRSRGSHSNTFCLEDNCECEGFKRASDQPIVKVARIRDALKETRGKLTLLRGGG